MARSVITLYGLLLFSSCLSAQDSGTYTTDECVVSMEDYCYGMTYTCQEDVGCENDGYSGDWYCTDPDAWERQMWTTQIEHHRFEHVSEERKIGSTDFTWENVECAYVRPCKDKCDYSLFAEDYLCNANLDIEPNPQFGMRYYSTVDGYCQWEEEESNYEP